MGEPVKNASSATPQAKALGAGAIAAVVTYGLVGAVAAAFAIRAVTNTTSPQPAAETSSPISAAQHQTALPAPDVTPAPLPSNVEMLVRKLRALGSLSEQDLMRTSDKIDCDNLTDTERLCGIVDPAPEYCLGAFKCTGVGFFLRDDHIIGVRVHGASKDIEQVRLRTYDELGDPETVERQAAAPPCSMVQFPSYFVVDGKVMFERRFCYGAGVYNTALIVSLR